MNIKERLAEQNRLKTLGLFNCNKCLATKPLSQKKAPDWNVCKDCKNLENLLKRAEKAAKKKGQVLVIPNGRFCSICKNTKGFEHFHNNSRGWIEGKGSVCKGCQKSNSEKYCSGCDTVYPHSGFSKCKSTKDGLSIRCRNCVAATHQKLEAKRRKENSLQYLLGSDFYDQERYTVPDFKKCTQCNETKAIHLFQKNFRNTTAHKSWCADCVNRKSYEYRQKEADRVAAAAAIKRMAKDGNNPRWITAEDTRNFYKVSQAMTEFTGIKHSVDHIDPLKNPLICGLNVPLNLQVVPKSQNLSKKNRFAPYRITKSGVEEKIVFGKKEKEELQMMLIASGLLKPLG